MADAMGAEGGQGATSHVPLVVPRDERRSLGTY